MCRYLVKLVMQCLETNFFLILKTKLANGILLGKLEHVHFSNGKVGLLFQVTVP